MGRKLDIKDLFVLSDILQMELQLTNHGEIRGEMSKAVEVPEIGLKMNMKIKVMDSKVGWRKAGGENFPVIGLVLKVQGNLFLWVMNDRKEGEIYVCVLDKDRERATGDIAWAIKDTASKSVAATMQYLKERNIVVAEFTREEYGTEWKAAA